MTNPPRQGSEGLAGAPRPLPGTIQVYRFLLESEEGLESFDLEVQCNPQRWAETPSTERIRVAVKRLRQYRPFATYRIVHIETTLPNV